MKYRPVVIAIAAIATAAVIIFVAWEHVGSRALVNGLQPGDPILLATGARVYAERCASCHGTQLEGQPDWQSRGADDLLPAPPHDATGHTWHHRDELLFRITKFGMAKAINLPDYKSSMPIYEGVLSDEEIVAVLSWIKSRWPTSVREKHDQLNAQTLNKPSRQIEGYPHQG